MKKIFFIMFLIFYIPSPLLADEAGDGLPMDVSARIKESAAQVISLGVGNDAVIKMTKTMLEKNFTEQQILEAYEVLIKAKKEDLPERPIMDKLYEGVAKNIQAEKILQAMEKVRSRYETASNYAVRFLGNGEQARVMTGNIAETMTAGVGTGDMDRIVGMLQQREMKRDKAAELATKTLKTARDMARTGVESKKIVDVVDNAFKKGYGAGDMEKLGNAFVTQSRTSSSPSDLASSYSNAIKQGATPDSLMKLGPGGVGGALGGPQPGSPGGDLGSPGAPPGSPGASGSPGTPPAGAGGTPPAGAGGTPPAGAGGTPPARAGGTPPAGAGGAPPAGAGGTPPAGAGGIPPAGAGGAPPGGPGGPPPGGPGGPPPGSPAQ